MTDRSQIIRGVLCTDVCFGPQGGLFVSDWVVGWAKTGKGRIYRLIDEKRAKSDLVDQTRTLLADGMGKHSDKELGALLSHVDQRVRSEAPFALAERGSRSIDILADVAVHGKGRLARIHAIWGLEQIGRKDVSATGRLLSLLRDKDSEIRAQAAKMLGERRTVEAQDSLVELLKDEEPRVRFLAAISLGKMGSQDSMEPVLEMIRHNADHDPYLRHAGVMALHGVADVQKIVGLSTDESRSVRMAAALALRRLERPEISAFLGDPDPMIVLEKARTINDVPISGAMTELASPIPCYAAWSTPTCAWGMPTPRPRSPPSLPRRMRPRHFAWQRCRAWVIGKSRWVGIASPIYGGPPPVGAILDRDSTPFKDKQHMIHILAMLPAGPADSITAR